MYVLFLGENRKRHDLTKIGIISATSVASLVSSQLPPFYPVFPKF